MTVSPGNPNQQDSAPRAAELQPLPADVFAKWNLAQGDIYFQHGAEGKLMLLKRAGDFLDQSWKVKWSKSSKLLIRQVVDSEVVTRIQTLFKDWLDAPTAEQAEVALNKLSLHCRDGLHDGGDISFMSWAHACYHIFSPSITIQDELSQCHEVLHQRAVYVSSLNVLFCLALGYNEPQFVREIYQIGWVMDIGLVNKNFTYWIALACQEEKQQPGNGIDFLRSRHASKAEEELFLSHPTLGYARLKQEWEAKMTFPALLNSVLHHHELADGSGFPAGINRSAMSDWESLVILADQLVDYRAAILKQYAQHALREIWQAFQRRQVVNCPVGHVWRRVGQWSELIREAA